jgi:tricorn protease
VLVAVACAAVAGLPAVAQNTATGNAQLGFARDPHYHNGQIVFSFRGNLWRVNEDGTDARMLTRLDARDTKPRFSPDGRWIAFTSNRNGNADVWVMPAEGGEARQLTWHSGNDDVQYWTPDGNAILFSSSRGPMAWESPLYTVSIDGGLPMAIEMGAGAAGMFSQDGSTLVFNRRRYPDPKRHYRGSNNTDVWVMDVQQATFRQLTDTRLEDYREHPHDAYPMHAADGWIYYMSERDGIFNVWKVREGSEPVQVTRHARGGVRFPAMSPDGRTVTYSNEFDLWVLHVDQQEPRRVPVDLGYIVDRNLTEIVSTANTADTFSPSPDGAYLAVDFRGEIFLVPSEEGVGERRRITESAWRQSNATYSPDGRSIAYLSDESSEQEVWLLDLDTGERRKLTTQPSKKTPVQWSPDARRVFFTSGTTVFAVDVASAEASAVADNPAGGYTLTQVSPDGRWLAMHRNNDFQNVDVVLWDTQERREHNVTDHPARDTNGLLTPDGSRLVFLSNRDAGTTHLFAVELAMPVDDPDDPLVKERRRQVEGETGSRAGGAGGRGGGPENAAANAAQPFDLRLDTRDIGRRAVQLTSGDDAVSNPFLSADGRTVHFLAGTGDERALWAVDLDGTDRRKIADGQFQAIQVTADGRTVFFREQNAIQKMTLAGRTKTPVRFQLSFAVDKREEWREMFDEFYRHWKYSYVEEDMHGFDWTGIRRRYEPLVDRIANTDDFYMLAGEMLFELNSSHSGISAPSGNTGGPPAGGRGGGPGGGQLEPNRTRFLGLELEPDDRGLRIEWIYRDGPADKAWLDVNEGDYVLAIDGTQVGPQDNYWKLLTGLLNEYVTVTVAASPAAPPAEHRDLRIRTVASLNNIKYEDWVTRNREYVDSVSGGRIAYFHMRSMNQAVLDRLKQEIDQYFHKQGMIIDVRYNGGGNIDMQLMDVLLRRPYQYTWTKTGSPVWGRRPQQLIAGPQVMLANWRSNSNAEMVPHAFSHLELGTLVGTPTNGAVVSAPNYPLLDGGSVRIPGTRVVSYDPAQPNNFGFDLENYGVPPDIWVRSSPQDEIRGFDRELNTAVEEALRLLATGRWQHVTTDGEPAGNGR